MDSRSQSPPQLLRAEASGLCAANAGPTIPQKVLWIGSFLEDLPTGCLGNMEAVDSSVLLSRKCPLQQLR